MATGLEVFSEDNFQVLESNPKALSVVTEWASALSMTTQKAFDEVSNLYKVARNWQKKVETRRKELIEPYRAKVNSINDDAKKMSEPLDKLITIANAKTGQYHLFLTQKKQEEDEKLRTAAKLFDAEEEIYIPPMETSLRGEGTTTITKTVKKFRVLDMDKIPMKYLMVNENLVNQDLKLGISEVAGLEIYEETTTNLRVR